MVQRKINLQMDIRLFALVETEKMHLRLSSILERIVRQFRPAVCGRIRLFSWSPCRISNGKKTYDGLTVFIHCQYTRPQAKWQARWTYVYLP